jgi:PAS domain S-box-containing protein
VKVDKTQNSPSRRKPPAFWSVRLTGLLLASILLLVIMSMLASRSLETLKEGNSWLLHTERVRYEIGQELQLLTDVETAERGFAVSRDERFLVPYQAALPQLPTMLASLKQLIADNSIQRSNVERLESLAQALIAHAQQVIERTRSGDVAAARALISSGAGKQIMDAARGIATKMQAEEARLLAIRAATDQSALHTAREVFWILSALAVLLLILIAYMTARDGALVWRAEETLATMLRSVGDGVISTDALGAIQYMNLIAERLTGWSVKEAGTRRLDEVFRIVNEETRETVESPVTKVLREGKVVGLANHTVLIARDGSELAIRDSGAPIVTASGDIGGVVLVFADASAERAAERALRESEEQARMLGDNISQLAWMAEPDGSIFWYNKRWYEYTGTDLAGMQDWGWRAVQHPDHIDRVLEELRRNWARAEPWEGTYLLRSAAGEYRWFLTRAEPIRDVDGKLVRWFGTNTDISERLRIEELVRERERRFVGLANTIPQLAWTNRPDGRYEFFNQGWYAYTGLTDQESLREDVWERVVHPEDLPRMRKVWKHSLASGDAYEIEFRLRRDDGDYRWFLARAIADRDQQGNIIEWFGTCTDIDNTKRNEESLRRTEAALREADRRKDVFLATLSHELRNPLAPIRNAASFLENSELKPADIERSRLIITRQVRHMASLLNDLLDVSRITRGVFALKREYVNLQGLLAEAAETARPLIDEKRHTLQMAWPTDSIEVEADPVRLVQIVTNLLTNAAKYTDPEGHITFSVQVEDDDIVIAVRDTGVGLAPEMLTHVFEMFAQVEPNKERTEGGLGIGLALVKGLVELHGGRVEARSEGLERGSEFIVFLPDLRVATGTVRQAASVDGAGADVPAMRRVLIADDNRDGAESLAMILELAGHEVLTAHTGPEALQMAAQHRPQVAILDIGMPGMSGYEVAQQIRREAWGVHMRLIAVTGWGQEDDRRQAQRAGFDHHLTKPVDPAALEELLVPVDRRRP